jgi:Zn-dependent protease with chaperone function
MVLLPLVYVGLIALVGWGGIAYAIHGTALFEGMKGARGRGGAVLMLAYFTPIFVAFTVCIFMVKPIFARPAKQPKSRSLDRATEPLLFDFVDRICQSVGAPVPKRIDVNGDVNASASFRNGWWSLLTPNDLVLTIGMPLAAGLSTRELGGVLAHEFGHFSQGAGMRLSYMIRSINFWFLRVVYQRDRADEWLKNTAAAVDLRFSIVLYLAMACVWLSRRILWVLMLIGNAVSSFLMRQMEFDADQYEIRLGGSETFVKTSRMLRRLGLAYQQSLSELEHFYNDGKLVDDLPRLVQQNSADQTPELITELEKHTAETKTQWLDTHPSDAERMAAAVAARAPGVLVLDAPATALFRDFPGLSKAVTLEFYKSCFGESFSPESLASVEELGDFKADARQAAAALERMFTKAFDTLRILNLEPAVDRNQPADVSLRQLRAARRAMSDTFADYEPLAKAFSEADTQWSTSLQLMAANRCNLTLKGEIKQKYPTDSLPALSQLSQQALAMMAHLNLQLGTFEEAFAQRVDAMLQWLYDQRRQPVDSLSVEECEQHLAAAERVVTCMSYLNQTHRKLLDLRNDFSSMSLVAASLANASSLTPPQNSYYQECLLRITSAVQHIRAAFAGVEYPFPHAKGQMLMDQYLAPNLPPTPDAAQSFHGAEALVANYHTVYFRSIGTLAALIERVESAAGLAE